MICPVSNCLSSNKALLGEGYFLLGKVCGSSFWKHRKILLSYDNKIGWSIVKLNHLQLFLRNRLGCYKSTHLDYILNKWNESRIEEEKDIQVKQQHLRLQNIWSRKYLIGLGNSALGEAQVIGVAERHLDETFRISIAEFLDRHYQEGDVVLVEGLAVDQEIKAKNHGQTRYVKGDYCVRGWEPKDFQKINGEAFAISNNKYRELCDHMEAIKSFLSTKDLLSNEQLNALEERLELLIKKIKDLNIYYQSRSKLVLKADQIIRLSFEKLKNRTLCDDGETDQNQVFLYLIVKVLSELEKQQDQALYNNMTKKQLKEVLSAVGQRNASLIGEIAKYRQMNRRVFVIAGAAHLLKFPAPHVDNKEVKQELKKHRFLILIKKSMAQRVAHLNSGLGSFVLA